MHRFPRVITMSLTLATFAASPSAAQAAEVEWLPRDARAIARTDSASREAPAVDYEYGAHAHAALGTELGIARLTTARESLRVGIYGLVTLDDAIGRGLFFPNELWRGLAGMTLAYSADAFARRAFGGGTFELSATFGHESDHASDVYFYEPHSADAIAMTNLGDVHYGGGGNFAVFDAALRVPFADRDASFTTRVTDRVFLDHDTADVAGIDAIVRLRTRTNIQPILAAYGEWRFPRSEVERTTDYARAYGGVALRGSAGEAIVFAAIDAGNGPGFLINERSVRGFVGVRWVPMFGR